MTFSAPHKNSVFCLVFKKWEKSQNRPKVQLSSTQAKQNFGQLLECAALAPVAIAMDSVADGWGAALRQNSPWVEVYESTPNNPAST